MKKTFQAVLVGFILVALAAAPLLSQSPEEIVQKMVKAMGGKKALEGIQDTTMTGTIELPQMGLSGTITVYKKEPDKRRADIEVMGMLITQAYDGKTAWWINPQTGATEEMPETEAANAKREAMPSVAILDPAKYGLSFTYKGKEKVDEKDHFVLEETFPDGFRVTLYLDTQTYLVTKSTGTVNTQMGEVAFEQLASDHKKVGGLTVPHTMRTFYNGAEYMTITLSEVKFNTGLEDSLFAMEK